MAPVVQTDFPSFWFNVISVYGLCLQDYKSTCSLNGYDLCQPG